MDGAVKVAVRIRPRNKREQQSAEIINKQKSTVLIKDPATLKQKTFTYDFVYDQQAGQDNIFTDIGQKVVAHVVEGYNATIFAYGQTGSGKTHTMMGNTEEPGLIPRIISELFNTAASSASEHRCTVSYAEIYKEQIFDLLVSDRTALHVREHPSLGPYIENLHHAAIEDAQHAMRFIEIGNKHRQTCATAMNISSSRSHALLMIQNSIRLNGREIQSKLFLVDLAGSERIFDSQVQGVHKQEAVEINKSLSALSRVIKQLSERQPHVSYRDSSLTFILKDSLGGNSMTYMIANCSPAAINYNETLNTLRYASSASRIVNQPHINEHSDEAIVAGLKEEIQALKNELARQKVSASSELVTRLKQDILDREHLMREREKTWEERMSESERIRQTAMKEIADLNAELASRGTIDQLIEKIGRLEARIELLIEYIMRESAFNAQQSRARQVAQ
jgi:kinesin family member 13